MCREWGNPAPTHDLIRRCQPGALSADAPVPLVDRAGITTDALGGRAPRPSPSWHAAGDGARRGTATGALPALPPSPLSPSGFHLRI
jgi:hypothetical protein